MASVSARERAFDALKPDYQFRADTVTLSAGNVATIPNRRGADALVMASGTLAAPASDAKFKGAPSIVFSGTQWLDSNLPPSAWAFGHDGSGLEIHCVMSEGAGNSDISVCGTCGLPSNSRGFRLRVYAMGPWLNVGNGASTVTVVGNGYLDYSTPPYVHGAVLKTAHPIQSQIFLNAMTLAAGFGAVPDAAAPEATFRLGAATGGAAPASMRVAELVIFRRVLHEWERQQMREYFQERYGIAAPVVVGVDREILSLRPFSWIRSDYYSTTNGRCTGIFDKALPGHSLAQPSFAYQCSQPSGGTPINGVPAFPFNANGVYNSTLAPSAWSFLHDGTGAESHHVHQLTSTIADTQPLYLTTNSAAYPGAIFYCNAYGRMGWDVYGSSPGNATFASQPQVIDLLPHYYSASHASSDTPKFRTYDRGVQLTATNPSYPVSLAAPLNTLRFGAWNGGQFPLSARVGEMLFFNRLLSASDRQRVNAYLINRYGF
jgi:hypothetical protein